MPGKAAATVVSSEAEAKPDSPSLLSALGPKEASADSADRGKNTSVGTFCDPWPTESVSLEWVLNKIWDEVCIPICDGGSH